MTLKRKILLRIYVLTFLIIIAMSMTYYYLFTKNIRMRSHQQIDVALQVIFDDLRTRVNTTLPKLEEFTQTLVVNPVNMINMFQQQQDEPGAEPSVRDIAKKMPYLSEIAFDIREFGKLVDATAILIYDQDRHLVASYQKKLETDLTGIYLPHVHGGMFALLRDGDLWYGMVQHLDDIPQSPLPAHIAATYEAEIPTAPHVTTDLFMEDRLTLRFTLPLLNKSDVSGVCVLHISIHQYDVERYARLSGTEVNVFAGSALSVGTLPAHNYLSIGKTTPRPTIDWLRDPALPSLDFSQITVRRNSYYQGLLTLGTADALSGAIAVNLPRHLEEQEKVRFFFIVAAITFGFSILVAAVAIGLSSAIVQPITRLMHVMQDVETGNFDVTAPVETQDEIGKLATTFNTMTAQIHISFARIEQQNRELKRLDKLKDEFLANTSHELRTPLHGIAGLAEAMLSGADGPLTDEERKHVQMILQSSQRLSGLVNTLLDFSKVRSEGIQLHRKPFPLTGVVDIVAAFSQELLNNKPVTLEIDIPDDLPEIYGDMDRVEQILTNLVGNAIKFTREGMITIAARQDGEMVRISVSDTGIGIPEESLDRIFQPFEQVDGSTTREFGGTGLGLAITKELVELHGGRIWVEGNEGLGSTFSALLPCSPGINARAESSSRLKPADRFIHSDAPRGNEQEHLQDASASLSVEPGDLSPGVSGEGRTILITDDDPTSVEVLRTHLSHAGFSVMVASNGQEAFEIINGFQVDLILCDVMMPLVDGYTFAMQVREDERLRDIPLIFVSAKDRKSDMLRGYQAGGIEYLTKPVDREELLMKISAILNHQQRVQERYVPADAVCTTNHVYDVNHDKEEQYTRVPAGYGERVLVVDDEPINIEVYKTHLTQYGYEVLTASNGPEALELIDHEHPDLVLLDLMMPKMSGFRVCQIIRQEKGLHNLPIIMLTAKSHIYDKVYGLNVGANDYIVKPFHRDELLTRMHVLLNTSALQQELIWKHQHLQAEIIEREQAEEALCESEERYRAIAETALDSIFCKDTERRYTFINPAMERLLGMPAKALLGKTPEEIFDPQSAAVIAEVDGPVLAGENVNEIKELTLGGTVYTFHTIQVPLRDVLGKVTGISGIARDITKQRQAEEEIRRLNEELELRVRQRTAELEVANKELKDFAYVVSHDLKAPLRGISRLAHWLTQDYADAIDAKGREMAELLIGRVKRMDALIDGILHYSRVGRVEERKERLDLNTLVNDVIDSLNLPDHIHVSIAHELPVITADRIRMTQVFQNLLSNAAKFLDKPEGEIAVKVCDDDEYWRFSITDNGPGIEAKYYERIFKIFQILSPRDKSESTGVGLSIVKKIVELQGGEIWVESQPGEGSTFFFTVPKT